MHRATYYISWATSNLNGSSNTNISCKQAWKRFVVFEECNQHWHDMLRCSQLEPRSCSTIMLSHIVWPRHNNTWSCCLISPQQQSQAQLLLILFECRITSLNHYPCIQKSCLNHHPCIQKSHPSIGEDKAESARKSSFHLIGQRRIKLFPLKSHVRMSSSHGLERVGVPLTTLMWMALRAQTFSCNQAWETKLLR